MGSIGVGGRPPLDHGCQPKWPELPEVVAEAQGLPQQRGVAAHVHRTEQGQCVPATTPSLKMESSFPVAAITDHHKWSGF